VGIAHSQRPKTIAALRDAGIDVRCWGRGWDSGRLSQQQMIEVFNQSRINLNFADSSAHGAPAGRLARMAERYIANPLRRAPVAWRAEVAAKAVAGRLRGGPRATAPPAQIKARTFEVPGCGGFLLTQAAENVSEYFEPGREIATFNDTDELIAKIRHYLSHESERAAVAERGHQRTINEHTYRHRLTKIFDRIGLAAPVAAPSSTILREAA